MTHSEQDKAHVPVDPLLLEILVCPVTRQPLRYDAEAGELISDAAGLAFAVVDGIPVMLPDEAHVLGAAAETGA